MNRNPRGSGKLARLIRYGAVALIAAWSLLAIAGYAALAAFARWNSSLDAPAGWAPGGEAVGEWLAWSGELLAQAGGPAIGIVWFVGIFVILGAMALVRRLAI